MHTVAVICEYNPFHNGHMHHINSIRNSLGDDTAIIALMSGSFTQRGDVAIADKGTRARAAAQCGVNLVIELPFPFCMSSAEYFARSAVSIINSLGVCDYISFGSECGDAEIIKNTAALLLSEKYRIRIRELCSSDLYEDLGYPRLCEIALRELFTDHSVASLTPNNILALEYVKAIMQSENQLAIHTIKREGADYNDANLFDTKYPSATAIRNELVCGNLNALDFIPDAARAVYASALSSAKAPCIGERLSNAVIANLRLNSTKIKCCEHYSDVGLYNRLVSACFKTDSIEGLVGLTETKKYTNARIRRELWYSLLGVTSSELKATPLYTQVLAMDEVGRSLLKSIRKHGRIPVLTKPTANKALSDAAQEQQARSMRAEALFQLTLPSFADGSMPYKFTPFVKHGE